jgi:dihydroneopterin aldolase
MKKLFAMFVVAGMVAFVACGPSAEEKAEKQRIQDSITADSTARVAAEQQRIADSTAMAAVEAAKADSIAKAGAK